MTSILMRRPTDRCGKHYAPCPYGGNEELCSRCDGDGEVENNGGKSFPRGCPHCGGKGTLAKPTAEWLAAGLPT